MPNPVMVRVVMAVFLCVFAVFALVWETFQIEEQLERLVALPLKTTQTKMTHLSKKYASTESCKALNGRAPQKMSAEQYENHMSRSLSPCICAHVACSLPLALPCAPAGTGTFACTHAHCCEGSEGALHGT